MAQCFAFKVALLDRWLVIVRGATLNEELSRYPEEVMSFQAAANEVTLHFSVSRCKK